MVWEVPEGMIMEIILRSSLRTRDAMRCTSKEVSKLTYGSNFHDNYTKRHNNIVFGYLLQKSIRGGSIHFQEFETSHDSSTLDLNFLPYNAKVLACSEHGLMVFKSPNPRFRMRDLYHICKPTTQQVLPLPNPKTKYTTQKVAIVIRCMNPLHYKIVRFSRPKDHVLVTKDKKIYNTHRVEVFDSIEWLWSPLPDIVKLPFCVSLTDPQPITTRGSIYMLLTNSDILRVDAYSATWDILTPPAPTRDQDATPKELVKYSGKLGFAFKPLDGCWEIWVLKIDRSWEKVDDFAMNQDIENQLIKADLCDAFCFHIFSFRSDSEPTDLMAG